jgi:hypothetical protein
MISSCSHHYFAVKLEGKVFLAREDWARRAGCAGAHHKGVFDRIIRICRRNRRDF